MNYQLIGNAVDGAEIGVILPTYREEENISRLIDDIESLKLNSTILVIDDSSPDRTAEIVGKNKVNTATSCFVFDLKKVGWERQLPMASSFF